MTAMGLTAALGLLKQVCGSVLSYKLKGKL